jgi:hypothetical protein
MPGNVIATKVSIVQRSFVVSSRTSALGRMLPSTYEQAGDRNQPQHHIRIVGTEVGFCCSSSGEIMDSMAA